MAAEQKSIIGVTMYFRPPNVELWATDNLIDLKQFRVAGFPRPAVELLREIFAKIIDNRTAHAPSISLMIDGLTIVRDSLNLPSPPSGKGQEEQSPATYEATGRLQGFEPGCVIGNRQSKKYHVPGSSGYERARGSKNAVYFKNIQKAEEAGYKPVRR